MKKSNLKFRTLVFRALATSLLWVTGPAFADVYRCDSAPGVITLSNIQKGKNCKKMNLPPLEPRASKPSADVGMAIPGSGSDAAKAKPSKYKSSYDSAISERKRIIQEEMDLEQERLDSINSKISAINSVQNKSSAQSKELAILQKKQGLHQGNLKLLQKEFNKQQ